MKINNKALMEFIGLLTVSASLVFVGMQLVLERKVAIIGYDNIYFQYRQGLIDDNTWLFFRQQIKRAMTADPELTSAIYLRYAKAHLLPVIQEIQHEIDSER